MRLEELVSSLSSELKSLLIQAGAGSGKTTALIDKVEILSDLYFKKHNRYPRLLICTFTRKATQELKERLYKKAIDKNNLDFLDYLSSTDCYISTLHGVFSLFLKRYGYKHNFNIDKISQTDSSRIADEVASSMIFKKYPHLLQKNPFSHLRESLEFYYKNQILFSDINFDNQQTEFIEYFNEFEKLAKEFSKEFHYQKKQQAVLSMEDIELWTWDMLNSAPETASLINKDWDYWLIDEYQDTSLIQESIIQKITQFNHVFCVGDPQQSIYTWRAADPEVFKRRLQALGDRARFLTTNHRSQQGLVSFFNDFFSQYEGFYKLKNKKPATSDVAVNFNYHENKEDIFKQVMWSIQKLISEGCNYKQICILSPKKKELFELSKFFKKNNIPVQLLARGFFIKRRPVLDACFLLKFFINPHDDTNLLALLRTPYFNIKDDEIAKIGQDVYLHNKQNKKLSIWDWSKQNHCKNEAIKDLSLLLDRQKEQGFIITFEKALLERGFFDLSDYRDPSGLEEANLWKLLNLLYKDQREGKTPLESYYSFLKEIREDDEEGAESVTSFKDDNFVRLMTIHSSKGLEFDHVFVLGPASNLKNHASEQVFDRDSKKMALSVALKGLEFSKEKSTEHKEILKKEKEKQKQERQRLLYVAFTRAKEQLHLFLLKDTKNFWFKEFPFFNEISQLKGKQTRKGYSLFVNHDVNSIIVSKPKNKIDIVKPIQQKAPSKHIIKNSHDFIKSFQVQEKKDFIPKKVENLFFASDKGSYLHECLYLINFYPYEHIKNKVLSSDFSVKNKNLILDAIEWLLSLKDPDMSLFFNKEGAEWSFQIPFKGSVLQGQIDLWSQKQDSIWVFDYKSSDKEKDATKRQLMFYSYVLDQIYHPKKLVMCALYPFQKTYDEMVFSEQDKKEVEAWLNSLV